MDFHRFLHSTTYDDLPAKSIRFGKRCLLDLIGVMAAGSQTRLSNIIAAHVASQFGPGDASAPICFDGRNVSPAGAALANGMMIDSVDAHDGFKPAKGHVGCHVLPTLLAFGANTTKRSGKEFLSDLIIGYEIGSRAGVALHASAPDYHTSGAWGAVTSAALGARLLGLSNETTRHAIGIGEYHGPRSQMMRVIDHPTMLKDGSGWGAMAGVSAVLLARDGFTGAPAISVEDESLTSIWRDLGREWRVTEQYFKPYPVCRWAQPAAAAALSLKERHGFSHQDIREIEVISFHEACRLATRRPTNTEQAQYSLPFPVAAALVFGKVGPDEIDGSSLQDTNVLRLSHDMILSEDAFYNSVFPEERFAHVKVRLVDGREFVSERHSAIGDPENPLTDDEITEKFYSLAGPLLGQSRAAQIHDTVEKLDELDDANALAELITPPI